MKPTGIVSMPPDSIGKVTYTSMVLGWYVRRA